MIQTTDHGSHLVHLDAVRGVGAMVLPGPATDNAGQEPTPAAAPGQEGWLIPHESLRGASWRAALLRLDGLR